MPGIISFIISICLAVTAIAQMSEADSLKNELQKTSNDSLKIIFYCLITDIYANFRSDSALFFAQQGLALSLLRNNMRTKTDKRAVKIFWDTYRLFENALIFQNKSKEQHALLITKQYRKCNGQKNKSYSLRIIS